MTRWSEYPKHGTRLAVLCLAACVGIACLPATAMAQGAKSKKGADSGEKKKGTIAEVEKKGKTATLTIEESDGEKFEVQVNAKTNFVVHAKGDISLFKHGGMHVSSEDVVRNPGNNYLHGKKFKIHLGGKGPGERMEQDPNSAEVCHIAGAVIDADDESFTFEAEGTPYRVAFDPGGVDVSIESIEVEHAVKGAQVEVEGATRAGKFIPTAITVTLEKQMTASEAFPGGDKKSAKKKAVGKSTKTTAKNDKGDKSDKGDDADKGKGGSTDPFGVLDGGSPKKDTKKPKPAPKKDKKPVDGDMN
ncbi:MAG: hypothetical protein HY290_14495 [Planctomycetia bacterium]|nr:hypothetical protein [Planctomycetia bacterium]